MAAIVQFEVGETTCFLEAVQSDTYQFKETSTESLVVAKLNDAAALVREMARVVHEELRKSETAPDAVEIEVALGFSAEAKAWVFGVSGEQKISVKLSWTKK